MSGMNSLDQSACKDNRAQSRGAPQPGGAAPRSEAVRGTLLAQGRPPAPGQTARAMSRRQVLVVDDCAPSRRLTSLYLREAGIQVHAVGSGRAAEEEIARANATGRPFDLVLTSLESAAAPDGLQTISRLRLRGFAGRIVALASLASGAGRATCASAGCDDWTSRPYLREELLEVVACHLADRQPRKEST